MESAELLEYQINIIYSVVNIRFVYELKTFRPFSPLSSPSPLSISFSLTIMISRDLWIPFQWVRSPIAICKFL